MTKIILVLIDVKYLNIGFKSRNHERISFYRCAIL